MTPSPPGLTTCISSAAAKGSKSRPTEQDPAGTPKTDREGVTIPTDEEPETSTGADANAAIVATIAALKPIIANLPPVQRRAAADATAKALRRVMGMNPPTKGGNVYARINQSMADGRRSNAGGMSLDDARQIGRDIMKARNPHYKG